MDRLQSLLFEVENNAERLVNNEREIWPDGTQVKLSDTAASTADKCAEIADILKSLGM